MIPYPPFYCWKRMNNCWEWKFLWQERGRGSVFFKTYSITERSGFHSLSFKGISHCSHIQYKFVTTIQGQRKTLSLGLMKPTTTNKQQLSKLGLGLAEFVLVNIDVKYQGPAPVLAWWLSQWSKRGQIQRSRVQLLPWSEFFFVLVWAQFQHNWEYRITVVYSRT